MGDPISATFSALADPTRRAILARLALGETSVTELAAPFEISMPAVSKHLRVLESAGLIARGREAQWRPCKLKPEPLREAAEWIDEYRKFWEQSFDRLDEYLLRLQAEQSKDAKQKKRPTKDIKITKETKDARKH
jgi:DNA-binding transcriptional ArsR family regulator